MRKSTVKPQTYEKGYGMARKRLPGPTPSSSSQRASSVPPTPASNQGTTIKQPPKPVEDGPAKQLSDSGPGSEPAETTAVAISPILTGQKTANPEEETEHQRN